MRTKYCLNLYSIESIITVKFLSKGMNVRTYKVKFIRTMIDFSVHRLGDV